MPFTNDETQHIYNAFAFVTSKLGSVEEKLAFLFKHSLKDDAERTAERLGWIAALRAEHADQLAKFDLEQAAQKRKLETAVATIDELITTVNKKETPNASE